MVFLIISNGIIEFTIFKLVQVKHRGNAFELISQGVPLSEQIIFKFRKSNLQDLSINLQWKSTDEFRYEDKMYDLVKIESLNDSVFIYCIQDDADSRLFRILDEFLCSGVGEDQDDPNELASLQIFLNHYYFIPDYQDNYFPRYNNIHHESFADILLDGVSQPITPPPQI